MKDWTDHSLDWQALNLPNPRTTRNPEAFENLLASPPLNLTYRGFKMPRRTDHMHDYPGMEKRTNVLNMWQKVT